MTQREQRHFTVFCFECGAKPDEECTSLVSGCVIRQGHITRYCDQMFDDKMERQRAKESRRQLSRK